MPASFPACWFDGRSSRGEPVRATLARGERGPVLRLHSPDGAGLLAHFEGEAVEWPEFPGMGRRRQALVVGLRDGSCLHLPDPSAWFCAAAAAGKRPTLAQRLQARWPLLAAAAGAVLAILLAFHLWGLPWLVARALPHVPPAWEQAISQQAMAQFDRLLLAPTRLPPSRQAELQARFDALLAHLGPLPPDTPVPQWSLHWRRGMGANAFALPGGRIVVTDGMLETVARHGLGDDAIAGVLAHEIGHVAHRHGMQLLLQQAALAAGSTLVLGDVAGALTTSGTILAHLSYRREHEREADCFALRLMQRAGVPPQPLARLLARLDRDPGAPMSWLSSHPATAERVKRLEESVESAGKPDSVRHGCP